jgi:acetoin utilization deacetylase AcuC-like enzyme
MFIYDHELFGEHDTGPGHPERAARIEAIRAQLERLRAQGLELLVREPERAAAVEELERVHTSAYVSKLMGLMGKRAQLDPETFVSERSVEAALWAAGAAIAAVDSVVAAQTKRAFVMARPPGHHAEPDVAMGFCLFNNVAVAAAHAMAAHGLERVMVLDWDVHHGNGTQRSFWQSEAVLTVDMHQDGLWPEQSGLLTEVGGERAPGYVINVPMTRGQGDDAYIAALDHLVLPIAREFSPQLVLISAGFDAHERDPLAQMLVSERGYAAMTRRMAALADEVAGGRLVMLLEGGYDLDGLASSVASCIEVLGESSGLEDVSAAWPLPQNLMEARAHHAAWWPVLGRGA